jgi:hypothetical protein
MILGLIQIAMSGRVIVKHLLLDTSGRRSFVNT